MITHMGLFESHQAATILIPIIIIWLTFVERALMHINRHRARDLNGHMLPIFFYMFEKLDKPLNAL